MKTQWAYYDFRTEIVTDNVGGSVAVQLHRTGTSGEEVLAAAVTYWDADGQFQVSVYVKQVPVTILEVVIAEARAAVPT